MSEPAPGDREGMFTDPTPKTTAEVEELQAEVISLRRKVDVLKETISWQARENKHLEAERDNLVHQLDRLEAAFGNKHPRPPRALRR